MVFLSWTSSYWHLTFLRVPKDSGIKKIRYLWGRAGREAQLSQKHLGDIHVPAFMWPWGPKRHRWEQTAQSGLGAGPTHLVCSLTPDTEGCSDLPSGPVTNGSYRKGSRTSLILFLVLLTAEPEVTKLSGACMKHTYQVELNKADLPIGHR